MTHKVLSTFVLDGFEKLLCAHGGWETICHAAHLTGNSMKLMSNALAAIECLVKRHPRMRTRLRVEANDYFLDTLEYNPEYLSNDLFFSTIDSNESSWQDVVERRCNQDPYSIDGTLIFPLFHFVLLFNSKALETEDRFQLLLFENHCASDGRSGLVLVNDFLTLVTSSNLNPTSEPLNADILPLISNLIPRPFGPFYPILSFLGWHIYQRELRKLTRPKIPVKLNPLPDSQSNRFDVPQYYTKFLFSSSSSDLYVNMHKQCRLHEVTLNGPLLACLQLATHHCFPLGDDTKLQPFPIGTAFDMRSRLPRSALTKTSVGVFIGVSEVKLRRSLSIRSARFWSLAKKCMVLTRNQLKSEGVPLVMNLLTDITTQGRSFARFTRSLPDGRHSELAFSNIGKYPFSCEYNHDEIRLRGLHVINNNSVYRTTAVVFATCAGDGQLDFSLAHEMDSDERAQQFLNTFLRLIDICADEKLCRRETTLNDLLNAIPS
ncbi:unnamed protein product [Rotaria magnacalcarata]|uniref:Uncharacterized protein n=5 Tax=Rotaria magnacalcarata TaxID=392030 RepID=A0A814N371_9BILA|nr:unnamed protein product [Rotaria magnacalcarata]CAF3770857.1 unnamed protein product [Rotaria magnacalcarata]